MQNKANYQERLRNLSNGKFLSSIKELASKDQDARFIDRQMLMLVNQYH